VGGRHAGRRKTKELVKYLPERRFDYLRIKAKAYKELTEMGGRTYLHRGRKFPRKGTQKGTGVKRKEETSDSSKTLVRLKTGAGKAIKKRGGGRKLGRRGPENWADDQAAASVDDRNIRQDSRGWRMEGPHLEFW